MASGFCLGIVRDGLSYYHRSRALDGLRRIGDIWALPELEEIAHSDDAEGIEEQLARTIEHLRQQVGEQQ